MFNSKEKIKDLEDKIKYLEDHLAHEKEMRGHWYSLLEKERAERDEIINANTAREIKLKIESEEYYLDVEVRKRELAEARYEAVMEVLSRQSKGTQE